MGPAPRDRTECEDVLRRIYRLPVREQLMVHRALREYLGGAAGEEDVLDKQIGEREAALDAMRRVAAHLGLADGVAPSTSQYRQAPQALTKGWSVTRIAGAWGRYRFAQQAFRGEAVPETSAQVSLRRSTSGRDGGRETHLSGVRQWLETRPSSMKEPDYDQYAKRRNSEIARGKAGGARLIKAQSVIRALGLHWPEVLSLAGDGADYDALRKQYEAERLARDGGALGLVGTATAAVMLGQSQTYVKSLRWQDGFPIPVLVLWRQCGWYADDIVAYREGRPIPARRENELRPLVLDSHELAVRLGIRDDSLRAARHRGSGEVPPADGRVGWSFYWMRDKTEEWLATHRRSHPLPSPPDVGAARASSR